MKTIASFEIAYDQFLNEEGKIIQELPTFAKDSKDLIEMYSMMTLVRTLDKKAVALQRTGRLSTYTGNLGQEAIGTAIGKALNNNDVFCPCYRENGALIQRGVKMSEILCFWGGDERGNNFSNKEDFPMCVPIATQCLHAAGIATAIKLKKQKRAVVVVIGDGGISKGDFYESINLAGTWNLPIVFVINNNNWAISMKRHEQTGAKTLAQKAIAGGFEGHQVDGNDVIAMRHTLEKALEKARIGNGPTVIEAITYRLCDHTTADDAKRYRTEAEVEEAWVKEPIARLRTYLANIKAWSKEQEVQLQEECIAEVEKAADEYLKLPPQPPESMFDFLYESLPKALEEQRREVMDNPQLGLQE